jgi:starch phosphorylase
MKEALINDIINNIKSKLLYQFGKTLEKATPQEIYKAVALTVRASIMPKWNASREELDSPNVKKLYYLSVEFLLGRSLSNNIINIVQSEEYQEALSRLDLSLEQIEECEADPGLGNGGLGRLAACFLDSLATLELPAMGCGIRYEYGLFKQKIVDGQQVEVPDAWLEDGNIWEVERPDSAVEIKFGGDIKEIWENGKLRIEHTGYHTVRAVPYDMPVVGYEGNVINTLRLWSARSPKRLDMESFSRGEYIKAMAEKELAEVISKVLYPADTHYEGKELRLKQHYFFTSATMQYIVSYALRCGADLHKLYDTAVIQINDTHPALAIPELMRILMDEYGFDWDSAWDVTTKIFAYTNHTVMSEALERWPVDLFKRQLPRIYSIICAINEHYCNKLWAFYPGQWEKIGQMAIIGYGEIRMANLCVAMAFHVNGVSQLHANILQRTLFRDSFVIEPSKFSGITNGITHRRWLMDANPLLTKLICETIGDKWKKEPERLNDLTPFASDAAFCEKFMAIKRANKVRFANWIHGYQNALLNPDSIFDAQAKRLHEYKRQLLNVLHILYLYDKLVPAKAATSCRRRTNRRKSFAGL